MNDNLSSNETFLGRKIDKKALRAFTTMLTVAALTPVALVIMGLVFWPTLWLVQPATVGAYPFYFAGYYASGYDGAPIRSINWLMSVPITIVQWILLSVIFARIARSLSRTRQIVFAIAAYFVISWLGGLAAHALGVDLVVARMRM